MLTGGISFIIDKFLINLIKSYLFVLDNLTIVIILVYILG